MELILKRIAKKKGYTIGRLYIKAPAPYNPPQGKAPYNPPQGKAPYNPPVGDEQSKRGDPLPPTGGLRGASGGLRGASGGLRGASEDLRGAPGGTPEGSFLCDTLEPTALELKTTVDKAAVLRSPRKTAALKPFAIPEGRYPLVVTWSPKFKEWLPLLLHVPGFEGIRMHVGNSAMDTQGCILVGENTMKGRVLNSRRTLSLIKRMLAHRPLGEGVHITIE